MGKVWKLPPLPPKFIPKPPTVDYTSGGGDAEVVRVIGAQALMDNLAQLPQVALDAAGYEMANIAHEIIVDAQENYVPIDTGDLHDSGDSDEYVPGVTNIVQISAWFGAPITGEQAAGGVKDVTRYALEQHENMELHHPPLHSRHREMVGQYFRPGGPKYLEIPFNNATPSVNPRIAVAIGGALGVGTSFVQLGLNTEKP